MSERLNESAFPNDGRWANDAPEGGLTKREYIAIAAMQGLLANPTHLDRWGDEAVISCSYQIADLMLAAGK